MLYETLYFIPTIILGGSWNWLLGVAYVIVVAFYLFRNNKSEGMSMAAGIGALFDMFVILLHIVVLLISVFVWDKLGITSLFNELEALIMILTISVVYVAYMVFIHKYYKIKDINFKKVSSLVILVIIGLSIIVPLIGLLVG